MTKWPMVPLGDVIAQDTTATQVRADREYPNFGIYSYGRGLFAKPPISGATTSASNLYQVHAGQFIYSRLFAFEGAYGFVGNEFDGCFISNEYPHFNPDPKRIRSEYLSTYFRWQKAWEQAATLSTGMGDRRRRIQPEQILKMAIPLPPLREQQRLIEYLDALNAKIDEAIRLRNEATSLHRLLWQGANRWLANNLGDVPQCPLGELVHIFGGGTPSKQNPFYWNGRIPWITPKDMKTREIVGAIDSITADGLTNSSACLLPVGAVLIVIRGMILVHTVPVAVLQIPATINQDMKALVPRDGVLPDFLCDVLRGLNHDLLECVDKSSHDTRKFTTSKLLNFRIPVPSLDVQRRLVADSNKFRTIQRDADYVAQQSKNELEAMLPAILAQIFQGKQS